MQSRDALNSIVYYLRLFVRPMDFPPYQSRDGINRLFEMLYQIEPYHYSLTLERFHSKDEGGTRCSVYPHSGREVRIDYGDNVQFSYANVHEWLGNGHTMTFGVKTMHEGLHYVPMRGCVTTNENALEWSYQVSFSFDRNWRLLSYGVSYNSNPFRVNLYENGSVESIQNLFDPVAQFVEQPNSKLAHDIAKCLLNRGDIFAFKPTDLPSAGYQTERVNNST